MKSKVAPLLVALLLLAQSAGAASPTATIQYGRSWPLSIIADSSAGLVYVDATSGIYPPTGFSFGVINVTSHAIKVLPLDVVPGDMTFDAARNLVYVAGTDSIEVFYGGTQTFVGNFSLGLPILHMAHDASGTGNLYITSGNSVYEIRPPSPQSDGHGIVTNATVGKGAAGLVLDRANSRLYVADYLSDSILIFDSSTLVPLGTINLPSCCPAQLALSPDAQTIYATMGTNYVDMANAKTDSFVGSVQVAPSSSNSTSNIVVDMGTGRAFVSFSTGGSIAELDPGGAFLGYLRVTSTPAGMAIYARTGELYVTNYHQVTVLDARGSEPGPSYAWGALSALGAVVAAIVLVVILRSSAWRDRDRPPKGDLEIPALSRGDSRHWTL